jgi:hypothetical protein
MGNFIEMDFDEWCDTYKPIINHIDSNASFDNGDGGVMVMRLSLLSLSPLPISGCMVRVTTVVPMYGMAGDL